MFYWLFKRYIKRLVKEYKTAFEIESAVNLGVLMRPDFYWFEKFLNDEFEWEAKDGNIVRRKKR